MILNSEVSIHLMWSRYPDLSEEALRRLESPNARYGDRALKRGEQQLTMSSKAMAHHHQQVLAHAQSARL